MPNLSDDLKCGRRWSMLLAPVLVLAIVYVLSSGPLPLLAARCDIAMDSETARHFVHEIYAPLYWLHDETPLEAPLNWYWQEWWVLFGCPMYYGVHGGVI